MPGADVDDAAQERAGREDGGAATDARAEGKTICMELLRELATIPGIAGAHIMAPVNPSVVPEVIERSGAHKLRRAPIR